MSKGLEALKRLGNGEYEDEEISNLYDTIEKELKALEIVRRYNFFNNRMTKEDFLKVLWEDERDLLKEVLKNEPK